MPLLLAATDIAASFAECLVMLNVSLIAAIARWVRHTLVCLVLDLAGLRRHQAGL